MNDAHNSQDNTEKDIQKINISQPEENSENTEVNHEETTGQNNPLLSLLSGNNNQPQQQEPNPPLNPNPFGMPPFGGGKGGDDNTQANPLSFFGNMTKNNDINNKNPFGNMMQLGKKENNNFYKNLMKNDEIKK